MDAEERRRGAGDEDAELVDGGVGGVERAVACEGRVGEREEEGWRDALVDGVFGDVDEEEREHAVVLRLVHNVGMGGELLCLGLWT